MERRQDAESGWPKDAMRHIAQRANEYHSDEDLTHEKQNEQIKPILLGWMRCDMEHRFSSSMRRLMFSEHEFVSNAFPFGFPMMCS